MLTALAVAIVRSISALPPRFPIAMRGQILVELAEVLMAQAFFLAPRWIVTSTLKLDLLTVVQSFLSVEVDHQYTDARFRRPPPLWKAEQPVRHLEASRTMVVRVLREVRDMASRARSAYTNERIWRDNFRFRALFTPEEFHLTMVFPSISSSTPGQTLALPVRERLGRFLGLPELAATAITHRHGEAWIYERYRKENELYADNVAFDLDQLEAQVADQIETESFFDGRRADFSPTHQLQHRWRHSYPAAPAPLASQERRTRYWSSYRKFAQPDGLVLQAIAEIEPLIARTHAEWPCTAPGAGSPAQSSSSFEGYTVVSPRGTVHYIRPLNVQITDS
mgnify:CR=1 FL=1